MKAGKCPLRQSYRFMGRGNWPGPDRRPSLHSCLMIIKCNSFFFGKCSFISSNMRVLKSPSVCHELISIVPAFSLLWRIFFNIAPELGLLDITWLLMIIQKQNDLSPIIISFFLVARCLCYYDFLSLGEEQSDAISLLFQM